jgi:AraC-like DNA-binding protein
MLYLQEEGGAAAEAGVDCADPSVDLANRVAAMIRRGYRGPLYLEDLCRAAGTNRTTLSCAFKGAFGCSVHKYLMRHRMEAAAELLRRSSMTEAQILDRVGFVSPSHFIRSFRAHFGMSPGEYRAAWRAKR